MDNKTVVVPVKKLDDLLLWATSQVCQHEETHRGGALWEICDHCGAKWADDEGGKPEFKYPAIVEEMYELIEAPQEEQPQAQDDYTISDLELAKLVMSDCGASSRSPSLEPGADPLAERIAKRIYSHRAAISAPAQAQAQDERVDAMCDYWYAQGFYGGWSANDRGDEAALKSIHARAANARRTALAQKPEQFWNVKGKPNHAAIARYNAQKPEASAGQDAQEPFAWHIAEESVFDGQVIREELMTTNVEQAAELAKNTKYTITQLFTTAQRADKPEGKAEQQAEPEFLRQILQIVYDDNLERGDRLQRIASKIWKEKGVSQ